MSQLQERERRAYDVLAGNRGQRKNGYQRFGRGPAPSVKPEAKEEEAPKRHWAELLGTIDLCDRVLGLYNVNVEQAAEPAPVVAEVSEERWSVPPQFKAPGPVTDGQKIDMNTIVMHSITALAPPTQAEPAPANGNALCQDLPMLQLRMLALRPKI